MEPAAATRGKQRTYALRPRRNNSGEPGARHPSASPPLLQGPPAILAASTAANVSRRRPCWEQLRSRKGADVCVRRGQGRKRGSPAHSTLESFLALSAAPSPEAAPARGSRSTSRMQRTARLPAFCEGQLHERQHPGPRLCGVRSEPIAPLGLSHLPTLSMHASSPMKASTATLSLARSQRAAAGDFGCTA